MKARGQVIDQQQVVTLEGVEGFATILSEDETKFHLTIHDADTMDRVIEAYNEESIIELEGRPTVVNLVVGDA